MPQDRHVAKGCAGGSHATSPETPDPKADKMARALMANGAMDDAKKFSDYICEAKKYPELDKVVVKLSNEFKLRINQEIKNIDSDVNNKTE